MLLCKDRYYDAERNDWSLTVHFALLVCRQTGDKTLVIPPGRYDFYRDRATDVSLWISNHDNNGARRVAFLVDGFADFAIQCEGAELFFHGYVMPFVIRNSRNVTLKGATIDWHHPLTAQGEILAADANAFVVRVRPEFNYTLKNGVLQFQGEGTDERCDWFMEFDSRTGRPAFGSGDNCGGKWYQPWVIEELSERVLRINAKLKHVPGVGNQMLLRYGSRNAPAVVICHSHGVDVKGVNVHHCGGMGLIAQRSSAIHLDGFNVVRRPGSPYAFSALADATHFVLCTGLITVENCRFEHQLDDALNIHGVYGRIVRRLAERELLVEFVHHQQQGNELFRRGERAAFIDNLTLSSYATGSVDAWLPVNERSAVVRFADDVPSGMIAGHCLENISNAPELVYRNNVARDNRARSMLIQGPGKFLIENNTISCPGAAILCGADANFWFESGGLEAVVIRGNEFRDCCYGVQAWGKSVIELLPQIKEIDKLETPFSGLIRIEGNRFIQGDPGILHARSCRRIEFINNVILPSDTYPETGLTEQTITLEGCEEFVSDGNRSERAGDDTTLARVVPGGGI